MRNSSIRISPGVIDGIRSIDTPLSVIINDFHFSINSVIPKEADSPLIINPDAILTFPVSNQLFQSVLRRNPQIIDILRSMNQAKFSQSDSLNTIGKSS